MRSVKIIALFLILLSWTNLSMGQSGEKARLEKQRSSLLKDIDYNKKLIKETQKKKSSSLNELLLLRQKIAKRQKLIHNLRSEIDLIDQDIEVNRLEILAKEQELDKLKDEYAQLIYNAYKTRSTYDKIMFVFASKDFNQAYKRLLYLQQYSTYRQSQAQLIVQTQEELNQKNLELADRKNEKKDLLSSKESETKNLDIDRTSKQKTYNSLNSKQKELEKELKEKERKKVNLQKAINRILEEERRKNTAGSKYKLTPEALALAANFESNKGKLPWPTDRGIVTGKFGKHAHPVLRGIIVHNRGIDISTDPGSQCRAVFDGQVVAVVVLQGMGKAIMVKHGTYLSVYSNLKEVYVKKDDMISTKQSIGTILTDNSDGSTEVHFELYKDGSKDPLNPTQWIYQLK
ncbi:peptidoglycan DD-metalloendopeptidase family protein [bacterium SCSIO 12741]|nr:peptidoglycan DD-metalloendopeptidase family protein [bacterium SCSIO 12741]